MKISKKLVVFGFCLAALVAWAAPLTIDGITRWMKSGAYFGSSSAASSQNLLADSRGMYFAYQFGTIVDPTFGARGGGIVDGPTIAKTGVLLGDTCGVASDRSIWDGGRPANVGFDCQVPANGYVLLRAIGYSNDAGIAITIPDAGYYFRTYGFSPR